MSRSAISLVRRVLATVALAGVAGIGAVAVAPAALAYDTTGTTTTTATDTTTTTTDPLVPAPAPPSTIDPAPASEPFVITANGRVLSPMPLVPIPVQCTHAKHGKHADDGKHGKHGKHGTCGTGGQHMLTGKAAQNYQSALATQLLREGYPIAFTSQGVLVVGTKA